MKPFLEKLPPHSDTSWTMLNRRLDDGIPFQWHHHPEFELTLTLNSRGQRFIGDHVGAYEDGDLVLVGSNLPHTWNSNLKIDESRPHVALVLWFSPEWVRTLSTTFKELREVAAMFERASPGLHFAEQPAAAVRPMIETLFTLPPAERLPLLLTILTLLARDGEARPLASHAFVPAPATSDRSRIDRVLDHIHQNYAERVSLPELAGIAALSPSGLHRLFRRQTQMTISDYLMRLKIGEACALLSASDRPIGHIAADVGYESLANFNRQFRRLRGTTPRQYRDRFRRS